MVHKSEIQEICKPPAPKYCLSSGSQRILLGILSVCIFCMQTFQEFVQANFCKENSLLKITMYHFKCCRIYASWKAHAHGDQNCCAYKGEQSGPSTSQKPKHSPLRRLKSFPGNDTMFAKTSK